MRAIADSFYMEESSKKLSLTHLPGREGAAKIKDFFLQNVFECLGDIIRDTDGCNPSLGK